jgi:hypothetical protein
MRETHYAVIVESKRVNGKVKQNFVKHLAAIRPHLFPRPHCSEMAMADTK